MRGHDICPDGGIYNILIGKAATCEEAAEWIEKMQEEGLGRDVGTYNTVMGKAGNFDEGKEWLDRMREEGIGPNVNTYCVLFTRDLTGKSASELLEWYLDEEHHPKEALEAAMRNYERAGKTGEALYLARAHPHLPAAARIIREYGERDI
jgi:pentatricopeptide repeat protein